MSLVQRGSRQTHTTSRMSSAGHTAVTSPHPAAWSQIALASDYARVCQELANLKRQQREQAETSQMLVHELRSPATVSKSLVAALRYLDQEEGAQVNDLLARIEKRMDQLLLLVDDILELSGIKAGHSLGEITSIDLISETKTVCQPYLEEAATKGLSMALDLPPEPLFLCIAPRALRLILSNLVSNAVKYTAEGSVQVSVRQDGRWVVVEVTDSGMGIPVGDIPRLFTELFRASNARRSQVPGTGLGLAGVRALVEGCAGLIELRSQENKGTTFVVRLPLHAGRPTTQGDTRKGRSASQNLIAKQMASIPVDCLGLEPAASSNQASGASACGPWSLAGPANGCNPEAGKRWCNGVQYRR